MSNLPKCIELRVVRSNKRKRTITIRKDYDNNSSYLYKSSRLSPDDFRFFIEVTNQSVLAAFVKSYQCELIKCIVPNRK